MKERLLQLLNTLDYSATRLADEIGVQRSGISHILSGRNQPSYDFMVKILNRFPDINAEWLILGKGDMYKVHDQPERTSFSKPTRPGIKENDLFNNFPEPKIALGNEIKKVTNVTSIMKVVLLHEDGTFEAFIQAKRD